MSYLRKSLSRLGNASSRFPSRLLSSSRYSKYFNCKGHAVSVQFVGPDADAHYKVKVVILKVKLSPALSLTIYIYIYMCVCVRARARAYVYICIELWKNLPDIMLTSFVKYGVQSRLAKVLGHSEKSLSPQ
jgi:hypothetical protein